MSRVKRLELEATLRDAQKSDHREGANAHVIEGLQAALARDDGRRLEAGMGPFVDLSNLREPTKADRTGWRNGPFGQGAARSADTGRSTWTNTTTGRSTSSEPGPFRTGTTSRSNMAGRFQSGRFQSGGRRETGTVVMFQPEAIVRLAVLVAFGEAALRVRHNAAQGKLETNDLGTELLRELRNVDPARVIFMALVLAANSQSAAYASAPSPASFAFSSP